MHAQRRPILAVIGDGGTLPAAVEEQAHELGRLAIDAGFRLVSGGRDGVMHAASQGARSSERYREGDVVAIIPGYDAGEASPAADIVIPTGLGHARNVLVVSTADVVIAVAGKAGTLSEMALAWKLGKPLVALARTGGWAQRLAGEAVDDRPHGVVLEAASPADAIARAREASSRRGRHEAQ